MTSSASPSVSDHEDDTSERILQAAFELFRDHGIRGTTTRAIAQRAGFNEITLFRKFKSKDGILQAITARAMAEFDTNMGLLDPEADPRQTLEILLNSARMAARRNADWFRIVLRNVHDYPVLAEIIDRMREPTHSAFINYLRGQIAAGRIGPVNPVSLAEMIFGPIVFMEILGCDESMHLVAPDLDRDDYARLHLQMVLAACVPAAPAVRAARARTAPKARRGLRTIRAALAALTLLPAVPALAATKSKTPAPAVQSEPRPTPMPVDNYLRQVLQSSESVAGARRAIEAANARAREGSLPYQPLLTAQYMHIDDQKPPTSNFMVPDGKMIDDLSVGVGYRTRYGTEGRLVHQFTHTNLDFPYDTVNLGGSPVPIDSVIPTKAFDHATYLEVSQPLVRNWMGREFNAIESASYQRAKAVGKQEEFYVRMALMQAELRYWQLALARSIIPVRQGTLKRAEELNAYIQGRVRKGLAESTELMQAQSQVKFRKLELRSAIDDEAAAARAFNVGRGRGADAAVTETIVLPPIESVLAVTAPNRSETREDIKAAREGVEAARLAAAATGEKFRPQVDLFGRFGFNGRSKEYGPSLGESFHRDPTWMLGFKVFFGFDLANARTVRRGYVEEAESSEMKATQLQHDFEAEYESAVRRIQENKDRLLLAVELEEYQYSKLNAERSRLRQGISTTYQVVQFEADYVGAVLNRVFAQSQIMFYMAQLRAYTEMPDYARLTAHNEDAQ